MKIPSSFTVAGARYDVRVQTKVPTVEGHRCIGHSDHDKHLVTIDSRLPEHAQVEVFWHEVVHCVNAIMARHDDLGEQLADSLAHGIHDVIQQVYES